MSSESIASAPEAPVAPRSDARPNELANGELCGDFRIVARIGAGSLGTVYRAEHRLFGKLAAIKVPHPSEAERAERVFAAARAAGRAHRQAVQVLAIESLADGRACLVMELCEGESLAQHRAGRARLPLEEALPILRRLARVIDGVHARGLTHGRIGAGDVLLVQEPGGGLLAKLGDFGENDGDAAGDRAALGRLAYELICGVPPASEPEPPSLLHADLPEEIDAPLLQMLGERRPPTAGHAIAALSEAARAGGAKLATSASDPPPEEDLRPQASGLSQKTLLQRLAKWVRS